MPLSEVAIYNMALRHLSHATEVQDRDEDTEVATACRRFYEQARDEVLRDFPWPFATKVDTLGLVESDPAPGWSYSYAVPSDCLFFRRILSGVWEDTPETRIPARLAYGASSEVIFTNMADAQAEYTVRVTSTARFPVDFGQALALLLAAYIAPSVTGGDPFKLGQRAANLYFMRVDAAKANAANEEQASQRPVPDFIGDR